jgi:hypothetical protein
MKEAKQPQPAPAAPRARLWCPRCHQRIRAGYVSGVALIQCSNSTCKFPTLEPGSRAHIALLLGKCGKNPTGVTRKPVEPEPPKPSPAPVVTVNQEAKTMTVDYGAAP